MEYLDPAEWNLKLIAVENVLYTKSYVTARIRGEMTITGKTKELYANGRVKAIDGNVYYLKSNYELKEADLEVVENQVFVQAVAETRISGDTMKTPADTIRMIVERSKFPDLKISFASMKDPKMSSEDASMRVAGMYYKDLSDSERMNLYRQELLRSIDITIMGSIFEEAVRKVLPVDRVRIEGILDNIIPTRYPSPLVLSIGKYLDKEGLYVGYNISSENMGERGFEISHRIDWISRLLRLPEGGEFLTVKHITGTKETIFTIEKQLRF
jgi:hypothetical protein